MIVVLFLSFMLSPVARAEKIFLKNGFTVEGAVKHKDEKKIILATEDGEIEFLLSEIKFIEDGKTAVKEQKQPITLYLKNGAVISGDLIKENEDGVLIHWQGGEVSFLQSEIKAIEYDKYVPEEEYLFPVDRENKWHYKNDVVVRLTNFEAVDVVIFKVDKDKVVVREELDGGGFIEQEIERSRVEDLLFKPVANEKSSVIENRLRKLFPQMELYHEGPFTILTDSHPASVKEYKKGLRQYLTDFYLGFFDLLCDRSLQMQNSIVIFDDWNDFAEFALADGVPGWSVAGYFSPTSEVLYMYNALGEKFSQILFNAIIEEPGANIDKQKEHLKRMFGGEHDIVIEGMADEIKFKYERYYKALYSYYKDMTLRVLRHEVTHELLYNYGLQNVVLSRLKKQNKESEIKKETDVDRKMGYLKRLFSLGKRELVELEAANSWLVEGMATYCEGYPLGAENKRWLFLFQEACRKERILPFEQLSVYKMGSFPGVAPEAMLYAYAQSWAFTHFLVNKYPSEFIEYQRKLSNESPEKMEDVEWFLKIVGRDLREIEKEFLEYMDGFPTLQDPEVNWVLLKNEIFGR